MNYYLPEEFNRPKVMDALRRLFKKSKPKEEEPPEVRQGEVADLPTFFRGRAPSTRSTQQTAIDTAKRAASPTAGLRYLKGGRNR